MPTVSIPNRPAGTDVRSIAQMLANFDAITDVVNGDLDGDNLSAAVREQAGISATGSARRGVTINTASEALPVAAVGVNTIATFAALQSLPTPDAVNDLVIPAGATVFLEYYAELAMTPVAASRTAMVSFALSFNGVPFRFLGAAYTAQAPSSLAENAGTVTTKYVYFTHVTHLGSTPTAFSATSTTAPGALPAAGVPILNAQNPLIFRNLGGATVDFEVRFLRNSSDCSAATIANRSLHVWYEV